MRCGECRSGGGSGGSEKKCLLSAAKASQRLKPCMNEVCRAQPTERGGGPLAVGRGRPQIPRLWRTLPPLPAKSALSRVIPKRERDFSSRCQPLARAGARVRRPGMRLRHNLFMRAALLNGRRPKGTAHGRGRPVP